MYRLLWLAAAFAVLPASAQPFPAPGTGAYTWQPVGVGPAGSRLDKPEPISFGPTGTLYGAGDTLYVYEPGPAGPPGGRWRRLGHPRLRINAILALDPAGDTLLVGRASTILSRSTDGGATWADVNGDYDNTGTGGPDRPGGFVVLPPGHVRAGRILAGTFPVYSDDRGATWTDATYTTQPNYSSASVFALLPSGRVLMAGDSGVLASDNAGQHYVATPIYGNRIVDGLATLATPGSVQSGTPACGLSDGALCEGAVAVGIVAGAPNVLAWWTRDGGRSWSPGVGLPQPRDGIGVSLVAGVVNVGRGPDGLGRAVAVLGRGLVYATRDGGQTWAAVGRMPLDLTNGIHFATYVTLGPDGHLWAVTYKAGTAASDVYRSAERVEAAFPVAGEASPGEAPEVGVTVRPNPASGRVEVVLTLAEAGAVRVVVLDALGREVAVAFDGTVGAGETGVDVETASWPPGVYVVRAEASGRVATARLVVAR